MDLKGLPQEPRHGAAPRINRICGPNSLDGCASTGAKSFKELHDLPCGDEDLE